MELSAAGHPTYDSDLDELRWAVTFGTYNEIIEVDGVNFYLQDDILRGIEIQSASQICPELVHSIKEKQTVIDPDQLDIFGGKNG